MMDLQKFCARSDEARTHLHAPWAHKGWRYATNGHIMIRVPSPADSAASDHKLAEKAERMIEQAGKASYQPLPAFDPPETCMVCSGKGQYKQRACTDCDAKGEFTHGSHTYDCKECEGDGYVRDDAGEMRDCGYCYGGFYRGRGAYVGDRQFDTYYLQLVSGLPNVRICVNGGDGAHFTFDGGEGLLMPWRPE